MRWVLGFGLNASLSARSAKFVIVPASGNGSADLINLKLQLYQPTSTDSSRSGVGAKKQTTMRSEDFDEQSSAFNCQRNKSTMKYSFKALILALTAVSSSAFAPSMHPTARAAPLSMSTRSSTASRPKRTIRDRTREETISLVRDITQAAFEAGPRAAPSRTLQAYIAVSRTLQDFSPFQPLITGEKAENFSAPVALRKLFGKMRRFKHNTVDYFSF